ncbi:MAG: 2-phospho-L-lactate guanylyltransferase [Acidobacteria bacterium]|nr:MAG: 2-phospho-L-lactate guanylyltransferase [Acidobacteriota bacterium]REK04414.1 MAG: 2-phospho-L-lactate guanylyltransferase [Acidobacteriota bacterium]
MSEAPPAIDEPSSAGRDVAHGPAATWALLPVKRPGRSKSRLTVLDDAERELLARHLLEDRLAQLAVLRERGVLAGIALVSNAPAASGAAARWQALLIAEPEHREPAAVRHDGAEPRLNAALAAAARELERGGAERLLILPIDLPLVRGADIEHLLAAFDDVATSARVLVAEDRHGDGTNALVLQPPTAIAPAFGAGSARRHLAAAPPGAVTRYRDERLGLDLDDPDDLELVLERLRAGGRCAPGDGSRAARFLLERFSAGPLTGPADASAQALEVSR